MSRVDLVLLHAPSVYDFREHSIMFGPVSDMVPSSPVFEMYPLGFTTMAEYMERNGLKVRIVNLAVLMLNRPDFDVEKAIREMNPVAFGIDLHWLPHAHGSVEIAKICKKFHPDTPVIFGGLSASFFHEELAGYPWVDYVVRGDSTEEPMTRLLYAIKGKGGVDDIPNLTYTTRHGSLHSTPFEWVPADMNDISLDYSYNMKSVIRYRDMMGFVPFKDWLQYPVCASLTCRGCTRNCVTCGGSAYSFRKHFGRDRVAFRDPELLVRDIEHFQKYIPGPVFVLNDFLQAGRDYTAEFIRGLAKINLRNPIGFEFFKPPAEDFYRFLNEHLDDYSVEISIETHDDDVRAAFGKTHYTTEQVEESIAAALRNGCSRFDLYMMTGIPTQTAASVLETPAYIESLYEKVGNDKRLLCFSSPMAPFLDPGSQVYDNPEKFGYTRLADTLEEHRQLLVQPSWKYIMNYESDALSKDEMVDTMYEVGLRLNRLKGRLGLIEPEVASRTEDRILQARDAMERIDAVMGEPDAGVRERKLAALKEEVDRLSESTVCEKTELNWPRYVSARNVYHVIVLWVKENLANLFGSRKRLAPRPRPACETPEV
jgi:B12-binding domain/radical SAM domain protein